MLTAPSLSVSFPLPGWPQRDRAGFGLQERGLLRDEIDEEIDEKVAH